eukprot:1105552-Rhodomonas_salina.1
MAESLTTDCDCDSHISNFGSFVSKHRVGRRISNQPLKVSIVHRILCQHPGTATVRYLST